MYQGKHTNPKCSTGKAVSLSKRRIVMILAVVLLLTCTVGGTLAYFMDFESSASHLSIGKVDCSATIGENQTITVTNTGNVPAYIRVKVLASWVSETETNVIVYGQPTLTITADDWTLGNDGFYYYNATVAAGASVTLSFQVPSEKPEGCRVKVDVLAEAIQVNAAADAWGFSPSGN